MQKVFCLFVLCSCEFERVVHICACVFHLRVLWRISPPCHNKLINHFHIWVGQTQRLKNSRLSVVHVSLRSTCRILRISPTQDLTTNTNQLVDKKWCEASSSDKLKQEPRKKNWISEKHRFDSYFHFFSFVMQHIPILILCNCDIIYFYWGKNILVYLNCKFIFL